jgi:hypothetical protein
MHLAWCLAASLLLGCGVGQTPSDEGGSPRARHPTTSATLSIVPQEATGTVYYVALNEAGASDENNGLYRSHRGGADGPWATVRRAASSMVAGDTTYVRGGIYFEAGIAFAHSGLAKAPITLAAYESEQVVIDGSRSRDRSSGIEIRDGRGHLIIEGLTIRNMPRSGITTDGASAQAYPDITVRDCILYDNGLSGVRLAAVDGFLVYNVEAHGNGYYGLDITGSDDGALSAANGLVQNCSFHHHTGKEGHGLAINQGHDITVRDSVAFHNTIHGFDTSDWPKRGELSHSLLFEGNRSYDNGVAGFAINSDSHHVVYRRNVAWRNGANWAGQGSSSGFLCYEGCWHIEWYNNVSLDNSDAGFYVQDQLGLYTTPGDHLLVFKNNIAYNNGRPQWDDHLALVVEGRHWELLVHHNNLVGEGGGNARVVAVGVVGDSGTIYTADEVNRGALQTGNVSLDPLFVDAAVPDVRLQPGSPCIDAGIDVGLPYLGSAPDIGAVEFEATTRHPRSPGVHLARSGNAHVLTFVRAAQGQAARDLVSFGDHVDNRDFEVGERGAVHVDKLLVALPVGHYSGRRSVEDKAGGKKIIQCSQVALIPHLGKTSGQGLVLFDRHVHPLLSITPDLWKRYTRHQKQLGVGRHLLSGIASFRRFGCP